MLGTWRPGVVHCHDYIGGAFQCVLMHAVVRLSAFQCKIVRLCMGKICLGPLVHNRSQNRRVGGSSL